MADIHFDPLVQSISKTLGNFVYSTSRDGTPQIRKRPRKAAWVTPEQTAYRQTFRAVAAAWMMLPGAIRKSWEKYRTGNASDYNIFMGENLTKIKKGEAMTLTRGTGLTAPAVIAASNEAGEVTLSYTAGTEPLFMDVFAEKKNAQGKTEMTVVKSGAAETTLTLTGLESGTEIALYCVFSDKAGADKGALSASQSVRVTVR